MPPSRPRPRSRRRLLADGVRVGGAALATGLLGACSDGDVVVPDEVSERDPMDLRPLALAGVRLPGRDDPVTVTVRGRRIAAVGPDPEAGADVLDLDGLWLVPGFVDSHVHMQFATPEQVLAGGVTTVRDLGGPTSAAQSLIGRTPLRVLIAGRILTPVGGYPSTSWGNDGTAREVRDVVDASTAVEEQVAAGATVVKVALEPANGQPLMAPEVLAAIVGRAREFNLRVTAHVGAPEALEMAIDAGVRELCHLPLHDVTPVEMLRAAEAAMVLVPTLAIRDRDGLDGALAAFAAFREAGGEVLYGSDLGNGGTSPGIMVEEVELMLAGGMSPTEVLRAATSDPALYLSLDTGRVEEDLVADLLVLGGDPLADPRHLDDVRLVVAAGEVVG